jgi:peptidoglycan/xylan/chitin deacetylase (PgdA/CDA1 family)
VIKYLVMQLLLTFDVEPDYTTGDADPYRHLSKFFKNVMPTLIKKEIPAILFITNIVVKQFTEDILQFTDFEIGVHTHPNYHEEYNKNNKLSRYPYEVQYKMIKKDYDLILTHTGKKPKLFRAGKFAANEDTLRVLRDIGIGIDSSLTVPYVFRFKALSKRPWRAFKEYNLIRIPVLAVDMRAFDLYFNLKNIWIDILDGEATCCICLHSWFAARYNHFDIKKYRFISLSQFLENERLLPVEK